MKSEVSNSVQMMSSPNTFSVNKDRLSKLNRVLKDSFYKDIIENSASYNTRLCLERKMRLPFLDAQTGVAQSDCALWIPKWQRMPGNNHGQIYTYPAKRWHKKRRQYLMNNRYLTGYGKESEMLETSKNVFKEQTPLPSPEVHQMNVVDNTVKIDQEDSIDKMAEDSKDSWFKDIENAVDPSDIGQIDDGDLDYVDYEETYKKKKRKVKNNRSKRKSEKNESHEEKPYSCDVCGIRYKTRPGLNYHYAHSHNDESVDTAEEDANLTPPLKISRPSSSGHSSMGTASDGSLAGLRKFQDSFTTFLKASSNESKPEPAKSVSPSPYCDFCLGDSIENKKTNLAEELVSCSDCGRSAHPTCLQFTPNMTVSVKKYFWQCIECKSCGLCGTSDNDAQLLFCDDCDRGYHMYCLTPPLQEPPEGLWSCHLCIEEYHKK